MPLSSSSEELRTLRRLDTMYSDESNVADLHIQCTKTRKLLPPSIKQGIGMNENYTNVDA